VKNLSEITLKEMMENLDSFCKKNEKNLANYRIEIYPLIKIDLEKDKCETKAIPNSVVFYDVESGEEFDFSEVPNI